MTGFLGGCHQAGRSSPAQETLASERSVVSVTSASLRVRHRRVAAAQDLAQHRVELALLFGHLAQAFVDDGEPRTRSGVILLLPFSRRRACGEIYDYRRP